MLPAVYLDRDGVINVNRPDYVKSVEEVEVYSFAPTAFEILNSLNIEIFIVTNQSCVNKGIITLEEADEIHRSILVSAKALSAISFICPHRVDEGCKCRKPNTEFHDIASRTYNTHGGWMIGDSPEDMLFAKRAGLEPLLVLTGRGKQTARRFTDVVQCATLLEAAKVIKWTQDTMQAIGQLA